VLERSWSRDFPRVFVLWRRQIVRCALGGLFFFLKSSFFLVFLCVVEAPQRFATLTASCLAIKCAHVSEGCRPGLRLFVNLVLEDYVFFCSFPCRECQQPLKPYLSSFSWPPDPMRVSQFPFRKATPCFSRPHYQSFFLSVPCPSLFPLTATGHDHLVRHTSIVPTHCSP